MTIVFNKYKFKLSFFLFLAIFAPPIIPNLNLMYLVALYAGISIFLDYSTYINEVLFSRRVIRFCKSMILISMYFLLPMLISILNKTLIEKTNYINVIYRFISIVLIFVPICSYSVMYCKKHYLSLDDFIEVLIVSSMYELFFCMLTIISPRIKAMLTSIMINNTGYYYNIQPWTIKQRFWGFASAMTDYFGYSVGVIAGICLWYAINKKQRFFILIPMLLLMIILNATTGIVIFLIFAMIILGNYIVSRRSNIKTILIFLLFILLFPVMIYLLKIYAPLGYEKIVNNFYQIINPSKVKASNTSIKELLSARHWQIPSSIFSIIFGSGHSLLSTEFFKRSDVGYINDIWSFGVLGMLFYMLEYIRFILCKVECEYKIIRYALVISMMIFNIKGVSVGCNSGALITLLIVFSCCYLSNETIGLKNANSD